MLCKFSNSFISLYFLFIPSAHLPHEPKPVAIMDGKIDGGIELNNIGSKQKSDENDMARLGKTPVLKALITSICLSSALTFLAAEFRIHVNSGLQLYGTYHMGRAFDVRLHVNYHVATASTLTFSRTFSQGLAK